MAKVRHQDQRVGVFVDVQNMYYSAKHNYNGKVDFKMILKEAVAGRKLIRAIAYVIKADVKDENAFYEALGEIGYEVKAKGLQIFYGGAKKGDWDVGIAMDVMRLTQKLDTIVLVSGDGDFSDLLEHAKSLGCRTEVMAFGQTTSHKLLGVADLFIDLDDKNKKYLLERKQQIRRKQEPGGKNRRTLPGNEQSFTPMKKPINNSPDETQQQQITVNKG